MLIADLSTPPKRRTLAARFARRGATLAALLLIVAGAGMVAANTGSATAQPGGAALQIIHASPDTPAIEAAIDGSVIARDLVASGSSSPAIVPAGMVTLRIALQSDPSRAVLTLPLDLAAGRTTTVIVAGRMNGEPSLRSIVLNDGGTSPPPGRVRLRFINAAAGTSPAALSTADGTQLTDPVAFGATGEVEMDGGTLSLRAATSTGDSPGAAATLSARSGTHSLVLVGPTGSGTGSTLMVISPAAPPRTAAAMRGPVGPGEVLFEETFGDPSAGLLPATAPPSADLQYGYAEGEYWLRNLQVATQSLAIPGSPEDATIAVDARLIGPTAQRTVSVGCRFMSGGGDSNNRGYRLRVEPGAGLYRLVREDGSRDFILRRDQVHPAIRRGNETNRLELTCAGTTITAVINGVTIATVEDRTYRSGPLVIGVGARADGLTSEARFDNLVVTQR